MGQNEWSLPCLRMSPTKTHHQPLSGAKHRGFTRRAGAWVQAAAVGHGSQSRADVWERQRCCSPDKENTTLLHAIISILLPLLEIL